MERTIKLKGIDSDRSYAKIEVKLEKVNKNRLNMNLKRISSYYTFSASGSILEKDDYIYTITSAGQNIDEIAKMYPNNKEVQTIKRLWKEYHLNDIQAGTTKQTRALKEWRNRPKGWSYDEDSRYLAKKKLNPSGGYMYGSDWLVKEIPYSTLVEMKKIIQKED